MVGAVVDNADKVLLVLCALQLFKAQSSGLSIDNSASFGNIIIDTMTDMARVQAMIGVRDTKFGRFVVFM